MSITFTGIDHYLISPNTSSNDKSAAKMMAAVNNEGKQDSVELRNLGILGKNNFLHMEVSNNGKKLSLNGEELRADLTNTSKIERLQVFFKDLLEHEKTNPNRYVGSIDNMADTSKFVMKYKSEQRIKKIDMFSKALALAAEKIRGRLQIRLN